MTAELLDRRVLGAVRFVDATTLLPIDVPLKVESEGARWSRNRGGLYVLMTAPDVASHASSWLQQPSDVALGSISVTLTVHDPSGRYLARRRTLALPRDPDPKKMPSSLPARPADFLPEQDDVVGSLFLPVDVVLFPAPSAPVAPGWAVVHATVGSTEETRLAGALIRVVRNADQKHLASALSDKRGEALVAVAGIPVTTWTHDSGPVVTTSVPVTLQVIHDPAAAKIPDPFDLEKRRVALEVRSTPATLVTGKQQPLTL